MRNQNTQEDFDNGVLHFTVGEDTGKIIMEIAQEKVMIDLDIHKGLAVITGSLIGCPQELALQILKGDMVLPVDTETGEVVCVDRSDGDVKNIKSDSSVNIYDRFRVLDFEKFFTTKQEEFNNYCEDLIAGIDNISKLFSLNSTYRVEFSYDAVIKYIYHEDDKEILEELRENSELNQMQLFFRFVKEFIEKSMKLSKLASEINNLYPDANIEFNDLELLTLTTKVQKFVAKEYDVVDDTIERKDDLVGKYISAMRDIDETIEAGIVPVDIDDNYSAGWLSPEGEYYGLNGEIANMLHNQIAVALQELGTIPEEDEHGVEQDPDSWLDEQGWVKIHGDHILFGGYDKAMYWLMNQESRKTETAPEMKPMTETQQNIIADYAKACHKSSLRLGFRFKVMSSNDFRQVEPIMLKNLFCAFM